MRFFMMSLLSCSAEMTVVSLVYMLILRILKDHQAPVLRYYSWFVIVGGFLMPFKPSFGTPAVTVTHDYDRIYPESVINISYSNLNIERFNWLFLVWFVGMLICLGKEIAGAVAFRKSIERLSRPADRDTQLLAEQTAAELGIYERVRVVVMREIATPMMTGLTAPVILLPERRFDPTELMLILRHELTHYKHEDLKLRLFFTLCRAVHWFNPVMRFIGRSIDEECEHYCDYSVMKNEPAEVRKYYCNSILNTVSAQRKAFCGVTPVLATNFFTPKQGLKHRLELILSGSRKRRYIFIGLVCVVLTILSGSVILVASEHTNTWRHTDIVRGVNNDGPYEVTVTTAHYPDAPDQQAVTTTIVVRPDETIYEQSAPLSDDSEAWNRYYEQHPEALNAGNDAPLSNDSEAWNRYYEAHPVTTAPMPQEIVMME